MQIRRRYVTTNSGNSPEETKKTGLLNFTHLETKTGKSGKLKNCAKKTWNLWGEKLSDKNDFIMRVYYVETTRCRRQRRTIVTQRYTSTKLKLLHKHTAQIDTLQNHSITVYPVVFHCPSYLGFE